MSNASQALIMAAGILLGVLILALTVTLFASFGSLSSKYDGAKQLEAVQRYNADFNKYLSRDLTVHEIKTIYNLAVNKGIKTVYMKNNAVLPANKQKVPPIEEIVGMYAPTTSDPVNPDGSDNNVPKYRIEVQYDNEGYINCIIIKM